MRDNQSQRLYLANFSLTVAAVGTQPPLPPPPHQPSPGLLLCLLSFPLSPISSLSSLSISLFSSLSSPFLLSLFSFYLSLFFSLFLSSLLSSYSLPSLSPLSPLSSLPPPPSPLFSCLLLSLLPPLPILPYNSFTPSPSSPPQSSHFFPLPPLFPTQAPPPLQPTSATIRTSLPALHNNKRVSLFNTRIKTLLHTLIRYLGIQFSPCLSRQEENWGRKDWLWGCGMWDVELKLLPIDHGSWSLERMDVRRARAGSGGDRVGRLWGCRGCCEYCML